jgi:hypothetical protein
MVMKAVDSLTQKLSNIWMQNKLVTALEGGKNNERYWIEW